MSRGTFTLAAAILAVALPACGAGRTSSDFMPPASSGSAASTRSGFVRLTITLPAIQPAGAPIDWASNPNLLSAATRSVSGSVGTRSFGPIALSTSQTGCEAASDGLSCAFSIQAPAGDGRPVRVRTYATSNGTGPVLASASLTMNLRGGKQRFVAPQMFAIAKDLVAQPLDANVRQGTWEPVPLAIYGIDAAKAPIPSHWVVDGRGRRVTGITAIKLSGFVNATLTGPNGGDVACCGGVGHVFAYDGLHVGSETFAVKADGFQPRTSLLKAIAGPSTLATIVTGSSYSNSPNYVNYVEQYASNANGNAPPIRSFVPPSGSNHPYGEDMLGTFWVGGTHFSNAGKILGSIAIPTTATALARDKAGNIYAATSCSIFEYPAGRYGRLAAIRRIDYPGCSQPSDLSVDAAGNIFVSVDGRSGAPSEILQYAPNSESGKVEPVRVIRPPNEGARITSIDTDATGNLYALTMGDDRAQLLKFAPATIAGKRLLSGISIQTFAVDDLGGIYARVYSEPGPGSLEYFAPGSETPAQIISGSLTELFDVGPIAVPRT